MRDLENHPITILRDLNNPFYPAIWHMPTHLDRSNIADRNNYYTFTDPLRDDSETLKSIQHLLSFRSNSNFLYKNKRFLMSRNLEIDALDREFLTTVGARLPNCPDAETLWKFLSGRGYMLGLINGNLIDLYEKHQNIVNKPVSQEQTQEVARLLKFYGLEKIKNVNVSTFLQMKSLMETGNYRLMLSDAKMFSRPPAGDLTFIFYSSVPSFSENCITPVLHIGTDVLSDVKSPLFVYHPEGGSLSEAFTFNGNQTDFSNAGTIVTKQTQSIVAKSILNQLPLAEGSNGRLVAGAGGAMMGSAINATAINGNITNLSGTLATTNGSFTATALNGSVVFDALLSGQEGLPPDALVHQVGHVIVQNGSMLANATQNFTMAGTERLVTGNVTDQANNVLYETYLDVNTNPAVTTSTGILSSRTDQNQTVSMAATSTVAGGTIQTIANNTATNIGADFTSIHGNITTEANQIIRKPAQAQVTNTNSEDNFSFLGYSHTDKVSQQTILKKSKYTALKGNVSFKSKDLDTLLASVVIVSRQKKFALSLAVKQSSKEQKRCHRRQNQLGFGYKLHRIVGNRRSNQGD